MKKLVALAAILAIFLTNSPSRAEDKKDSNAYLKGSYQDAGRYSINLGGQLKLDNLSPYVDTLLDKSSQNINGGLKIEGIGEMIGGFLSSNSQESAGRQSNYDKNLTVTNGTARNWGITSETETLEEKISGYRGGAEIGFRDQTFGIKVQYLNSGKTTTSQSSNLTKTTDNYQENTHENPGVPIDIETKIETDVDVNTNVNAETKENQNSAKVQLDIADVFQPYWIYNAGSVNSRINTTTKVDSLTTGYTKITINNGTPTTTPISSTSSTNSTNLQDITQEQKQNLFGGILKLNFGDFTPITEVRYNDSSQKIDYSIVSITKFLGVEKIGYENQNGKSNYLFEISNGKNNYQNAITHEDNLKNINNSIIYDDSKKQQLKDIAGDDYLSKTDWRIKVGYKDSVTANIGANIGPGFLDLGYDNSNQTISGRFVAPDYAANISYSAADKKLEGGIRYFLK